MIVAASPQRPYEQWAYDCTKLDIVVAGPQKIRETIVQRLREEKKAALAEKQNISEYLFQFGKPFQDLYDSGMVDGILGRGSYFTVNGFPVEDENLNFMFLRTAVWSKEETSKILDALKRLPAARLWVLGAGYREELIKSGNGKKAVYFTLIDRDSAARGRGLRYEEYVLRNSPGIELRGLSREGSETIAKELSALLPNRNLVSGLGISRLPDFDRFK